MGQRSCERFHCAKAEPHGCTDQCLQNVKKALANPGSRSRRADVQLESVVQIPNADMQTDSPSEV